MKTIKIKDKEYIIQTDLAKMLCLNETTIYYFRKKESLKAIEYKIDGRRVVCYEINEVQKFFAEKHPKYLIAFANNTEKLIDKRILIDKIKDINFKILEVLELLELKSY